MGKKGISCDPDRGPLERKLDEILSLLKKGLLHMSKLDDAIVKLRSDVTTLTSVNASAIALIGGIAAQVAAAVSDALADGATPAELQSLSDLSDALEAQDTALAAAVSANTPAPPAPAPAP